MIDFLFKFHNKVNVFPQWIKDLGVDAYFEL